MLKYHSVQPENFKTEYVETDIIDFVLSFPADKIESGSIRVNADGFKFTDGASGTFSRLYANGLSLNTNDNSQAITAEGNIMITGSSGRGIDFRTSNGGFVRRVQSISFN